MLMTRASDLFAAAERLAEAKRKDAQQRVERASIGCKHYRKAKLYDAAHDALRAGLVR
jgi:hypothetical protein